MQRTEKVPTADGEITVRRMYHKPAREFIHKFAKVIRERGSQLARDGDGGLMLTNLEKLPEIIAEVDELAGHMVEASTDDALALGKLSLAEWLQVLAAALRLNCGPELKNSFAAIGAALAPLLAANPTNPTSSGDAPTPSSSKQATTPAT